LFKYIVLILTYIHNLHPLYYRSYPQSNTIATLVNLKKKPENNKKPKVAK